MKTTTKKTNETKSTKTEKTTKPKTKTNDQKMVERIFNANNESIDYFRTRLTSNAIAINTLFIRNKTKTFSMHDIVTKTKLKKSRVRAHLYWLSKTFDHITRNIDNTYTFNAKSKCVKNVDAKLK